MFPVIVALLGTARYRSVYDLPAFSGVLHVSGNRYTIGYRSVSFRQWIILPSFRCTLPVRRCALKTEHCSLLRYDLALTEPALWSSFRLISISQLNALLHLHL